MNKISVVISAYNEEKNIEECLKSVADFADEIIVVDNGSSDKTSEISKEFTKNVYEQKNDPEKIDLQKNFGFSKATGDWILSLDADERVPAELAKEIESRIMPWPQGPRPGGNHESGIDGYWIPRKNIIFGKWIKSDMWWPDFQLRLFKNGKGKFGQNSVHTALTVDGQTEKLENFLLHQNYTSVFQYIEKLNNYTGIEAENLAKDGYKFVWIDAIRFPVDDFVKTFFFQKGYTDGLHGLVLSMLQAFYMEVVFAKLWEKRKFEEIESSSFIKEVGSELINSGNKIRYWIADSLINNSKNPLKKIMLKTSRKLIGSKITK